jgi:hypothetical protein
MRARVDARRPLSTNSLVDRSVDGSIVTTQTPSKGGAPAEETARRSGELVDVGAAVREPDEVVTESRYRHRRHDMEVSQSPESWDAAAPRGGR